MRAFASFRGLAVRGIVAMDLIDVAGSEREDCRQNRPASQ